MAVTNLTATPIGGGLWRVSWTGAGGPYYVFLDGSLLLQTLGTSTTLPGGRSVYVDDTGAGPAVAFARQATVYWYGNAAVDRYEVQQYVAAAWVVRANVADDGRGHFNWPSGDLADDQQHQFRVLGYDGEVPGDVASLTVWMVRRPDAPKAAYSYNPATRVVTVADDA